MLAATTALSLAASALVSPGTPAPAFTSVDQNGSPVSLATLRGHPVVLYFYPMDRTPG